MNLRNIRVFFLAITAVAVTLGFSSCNSKIDNPKQSNFIGTWQLKKMEAKGYLTRERSKEDERNLIISITPEGEALKGEAAEVPVQVRRCVNITREKSLQLYNILYEILADF